MAKSESSSTGQRRSKNKKHHTTASTSIRKSSRRSNHKANNNNTNTSDDGVRIRISRSRRKMSRIEEGDEVAAATERNALAMREKNDGNVIERSSSESGYFRTIVRSVIVKDSDRKDNEDGDLLDQLPPLKPDLLFVKYVVKYPKLIFILLFGMCMVVTMSLGPLVFSKGNPFTDPSALYDIYDIRSVAYDSFRLAREEVMELREAFQMETSDKKDEPTQIQEDGADVTFWIYESQNTETGLFGSAESIQYMRRAEMLFPSHPDFVKFCRLEYTYDESLGRNTSQCEKPLSALNMYYASE